MALTLLERGRSEVPALETDCCCWSTGVGLRVISQGCAKLEDGEKRGGERTGSVDQDWREKPDDPRESASELGRSVVRMTVESEVVVDNGCAPGIMADG